MAKLKSRVATIAVQSWGLRTGAPVAGATSQLALIARDYNEETSFTDIDQTAIGDTTRDLSREYEEKTVEFACFVPDTGPIFEPLLDEWVRVIRDLNGAGAGITPVNTDGEIIRHRIVLSVNDSQIEEVTIRKIATAFA